MSSIKKTEGSNSLKVPNGGATTNGQDRTLARLANIGQNDSVKSTYSLSVFLDPDASKDMVRHEELWYPMNDSTSTDNLDVTGTNQDQRTATLSAAAGSKKSTELTQETKEKMLTASNQVPIHGQKQEPLRNGSKSTTSTTGASRSADKIDWSGKQSGTDTENHFNKNTVVLGVQSGGRGGGAEGGEGGGGGAEGVGGGAGEARESGYGVRRWSTERSLPKASEAQDTEDDAYGEEVTEQEEIGLIRSQIEDTGLIRSQIEDNGQIRSKIEDNVQLRSKIKDNGQIRSRIEDNGQIRSKIEETGDRYSSGIHAGQGAARILKLSNSVTEEDADGYHTVTRRRQTSEKTLNGSDSAAGEDEFVNYSSAMQPRMSRGQARSRPQPMNFADNGRSSNAVNRDRDASLMQMTQMRNALDDEDSTVTEGSDEGSTGKSYHRESIPTKAKFSRAMAVDEKYRGIEHEIYQSGQSEVTSARINNSSTPFVGEISDNYQRRRNGIGLGREGIRRATSQSETEAWEVNIANSLTYTGPYDRKSTQDVSSDDDRKDWNRPSRMLSRQKDQNLSSYSNRTTNQESFSEDEPADLRRGIGQATPVIRVTTPSSSSYTENRRTSQQEHSDEDFGEMNARSNAPQVVPTPRLRGLASNGIPNAPTASHNITSEEEETVSSSGRHRTSGQVSKFSKPADVDQYRPHPAARKTLGAAGSHSSAAQSSPRQPYSPNNYTSRAPNTRGRGSIETDSVGASDDSSTPNDSVKGNAPTRRMYRERGYAINSDVQPRSGTLLNAAGLSDGYSDSSFSNPTHRPQHRILPTNQTMGYSGESDIENNQKTRSQRKFMLDFPSESEDQGTGYSKRKTTVRKETTPVTGVMSVTPQLSSSEVVREKITKTKTMKTTPVTGVVSISDAELRHRQAASSIERTRTPIVGLISVSRSPSPERTKTPVVRETITKSVKTTPISGVISIPDAEPIQRQSVASIERTRTPIVGMISVSRSPSPERTKTPVVGVISLQQSHSVAPTARSSQPITGLISVTSNTQIQRRTTTPSAHLIPDGNNNSACSGKFHLHNRTDLARTVIEKRAVPTPETQTEIVGVDPELKRAQKTGSNHYQITMNLRPVVGDSVSELGYELYNTAVGKATPISTDRLRVSGSRADWRYSESDDGSYFRPPTVTTGTLGSWHSSVRTPGSQLGFVSSRSNRQQAYSMGPRSSAGNFGAEKLYYQDIPRSYSVETMNRNRSLSRQGPQFPHNTLLQVPPILQTVTSRPRRLSSDGYNPGFPGERRRQQTCSSTMSSVFLSPTLERRYNPTVNGPYSSRSDTLYRY